MKDSKILIINPVIRKEDKPRHLPHGLAILANIIKQKTKTTPIFLDINANRYTNRQVEQYIDDIKADTVLIGGLIPVYNDIIKITNYIKNTYPETNVIAGGSVAVSMPEILLDNSKIDMVCTGEGELVIMDMLKKKLNRNGIAYRENGDVMINPPRKLIKSLDTQSGLPAYDLLPMDIYLSNPCVGIGKDIDFISSRGCPYRCTFCAQFWGHKSRYHSSEFIVKTIKYLKDTYNVNFISFQDDEFISNKNRVIEFCKLKKKEAQDILWSCTGRTNIIANDEKLLKLMIKSGCVSVSYGFESGSQEMLNRMNKMQTIKQMEKVVGLSRKYKLPIPTSFIIGMPDETKDSCKETLDFSLRNNIPLDSLMFATPYPGTEIFNFAMRTNRIGNVHEFAMNLGDARKFTINLTDEFTNRELINTRNYMMKEARENYESYITNDEIVENLKRLFGKSYDKYPLTDEYITQRMKYGGIYVF